MKYFQVLFAIIGLFMAVGIGAPVLDDDTTNVLATLTENKSVASAGSGFVASCVNSGIQSEHGRSFLFSACDDGTSYNIVSLLDLNICYGYDAVKGQLFPEKNGNFNDHGCEHCTVLHDGHTLECLCNLDLVQTNLNVIVGNDFGILSCWDEHAVIS